MKFKFKTLLTINTLIALSAIIFFFSIPVDIYAQNGGVLDELKVFLDKWYITEVAFLGLTMGVTQFVSKIFALTEQKIIMGISFLVTLVFALIGFFLNLGIFAEIGIFNLIVFVFTKTFAGNGFYDWLRLFGVLGSKKDKA